MIIVKNKKRIYLLLWISLAMTLELLGLRVLEVKVPPMVKEGDSVSLSCLIDLQGESLYSLNWWRDSDQFYQFSLSDDSQQIVYEAPGITVDKSQSSLKMVMLRNVTQKTSGEFKCEIVAEFPSYERDFCTAPMQVVEVPRAPPIISLGRKHYKVGDHLKANCTAQGSSPLPVIHWYLNGKKVSGKHVRQLHHRKRAHSGGKGHRRPRSARKRPSPVTSHVSIVVRSLNEGRATLTCSATYSGVFHRSTEADLTLPDVLSVKSSQHVASDSKQPNISQILTTLMTVLNFIRF